MKLKIEIPKIHCKRTTIELGKDEIYGGVIAFAVKIKDGEFERSGDQPLFASLTEVKEKVIKDSIWKPNLQNEIFEVDDDVTIACVSLLLFEEDNGKHYQKLQENFNEILLPDKFDWSELFVKVKEAVLEYYKENGKQFVNLKEAYSKDAVGTMLIIGSAVIKIMKVVIAHLSQDDSLGVSSMIIDLSQPGFDFDYKKKFEKFRGEYNVSLKVSKI